MRPLFTLRYFLLFVCASMLVSELHEQAHIQTGYLVCSAYGPRDFVSWRAACDAPAALLAPVAGPLFSCLLAWIGVALLYVGHTAQRQWLGLTLLFAALPFARIFTAAMGGGDEKIIFSSLLGDGATAGMVRMWALGVTLLLCGVPIVLGLRNLAPGVRGKAFLLFCICPLLVSFALTHTLYNRLLERSPLLQTTWAGTPLAVWLHLASMGGLLYAFRHGLRDFRQKEMPVLRRTIPVAELSNSA